MRALPRTQVSPLIAAKETEPAHFVEPGLVVVREGGTLYASIVQSMP